MLASTDVCLIPFTPLINRVPQVLGLVGLKSFTISNGTQQLPLPDQDQPK
jgi:hypothetical protein